MTRLIRALAGAALLSACGGNPDSHVNGPGEGSISVALTNAPSDAACLRLTIDTSRSSPYLFDLTPGASTASYRINRLPLGRAVVDGQAYGVGCSKLDSFTGDPLFVSEAPVAVRVDPSDVNPVVLKLIRNGRLDVGVDFENSTTAYLVPTAPGVIFKDLITAGSSVNGYRMAGIPDGLGAFDNGDGTFTVLMNHELGATSGAPRAHGAKGAFVSRWTVRKSDLTVLSGQDLIQNVQVWIPGSSSYGPPAAPVAFGRFCSADLPGPSAFYDAPTGKGFNGRLFLNGEENGSEGRAFAHGLDGTSWELPRLGKLSFENVVANPGTGEKTLVAATGDSTPGKVYLYVGTKTTSGTPVERAGLTNGTLYGVRVGNVALEDAAAGIPSGTPFTLVDLGNVEAKTGADLEAQSTAAGATRFNRPEDNAWDPRNPRDLYFVTTASFTGASRLWRLRFSDLGNPAAGGTLDMLLNGSEGQKMLDNLAVDRSGHIILQEDVGNQTHLGKVWRYDIVNGTLTQIAQHDPQRFMPGAPAFLTQDEESSGVIDMAAILGPGWYLLDVQAHYATDAETVEGGQLLAMFDPTWVDASKQKVEYAVIGDAPYGATQIADFPNLISAINDAANISRVVHVGDIKNGSSRCDDSYNAQVFSALQTLLDPLVYTPGDNEWTDCHRANNGAFDPLERLGAIRTLFFPNPGRTLAGARKDVLTQSALPAFATFVENTLWSEAQVTFAALHVVGSDNSLLPWYTDSGGTKTDDPARRIAEEQARDAANLDWLDRTFTLATRQGSKGVVLFLQADMWDPAIFTANQFDGFTNTVRRIADLTRASGKPVLLINGDSHVFTSDNPLAAGDARYGVTAAVPNLRRITVQGSTTAPLTEWLRLRVDSSTAAVFSWERNPR